MSNINKATLIKELLDHLFVAEARRLNAHIVRLNQANKEATRTKFDGFLFEGSFFLPKQPTQLIASRSQHRTVLHPRLHEEMRNYLIDHDRIQADRKFFEQILCLVLLPCKSTQDIRDALPECLVDCVVELCALTRTRPEAWTLAGNQRTRYQYEEFLSQMRVYSAARLFY